MINKDLKRRIIDVSYKQKLSHLSSVLTALDIIYDIYKLKKPSDRFVLSAGHSHLAHAVVMEKYGVIEDAEENIKTYGIHCEREGGCDVSTGSLGQGLPIAVGMALADRNRDVYCLISDGECAEGSIWEALRIADEQKLTNLKVHCNANGWSAYGETDIDDLKDKFIGFFPVEIIETDVDDFPFLKELEGHYHTMNEADYKLAMEVLK